MTTIVFASQKGGSGKTTLCSHLAVTAERAGDGPIYLIDTDQQGTLTEWRSRRQASTPRLLEGTDPRALRDGAGAASPPARYVLIDTTPAAGNATLAICRLADLVVIPVRPSAADLWSVADTIDRFEQYRIPYLFALTQARAGASAAAETIAALSHFGPVADAIQYARSIYGTAIVDGRTAGELARPAALETAALWRAIVRRLSVITDTNRKGTP